MTGSSLDGVHPRLVASMRQILAAMTLLGFPMRVTEGVRTDTRQIALYAEGRTAAGAVVTHCDGVRSRSAHQVQADGFGHAVDCCFATATPYEGPWALYGAMGVALGLIWGGGFSTLVDRPHLELPSAAFRVSQLPRAASSSSSS